MGAPRYTFIFCDDVRRELGGRRSLMGTFGPLVRAQGSVVSGVTVACMANVCYGADLSGDDIWIGMVKDGKAMRKLEFAQIPPEYYSLDKNLEERTYLESLIPGFESRMNIVGVLNIKGPIRFENYVEFRAHVGSVEFDKIVFFKMPVTVEPSSGTPRKVRSSPGPISKAHVSGTKKIASTSGRKSKG